MSLVLIIMNILQSLISYSYDQMMQNYITEKVSYLHDHSRHPHKKGKLEWLIFFHKQWCASLMQFSVWQLILTKSTSGVFNFIKNKWCWHFDTKFLRYKNGWYRWHRKRKLGGSVVSHGMEKLFLFSTERSFSN